MHKIRQWVTIALMTLTIMCGFTTHALAAGYNPFKSVCNVASGASSSATCSADGSNTISGPNGVINKVANIFAFLTGIAAVFVIMIGGFMYLTSGGDAGKAKSGRSAVIYACVGLAVVVLARVIINFVISKY